MSLLGRLKGLLGNDAPAAPDADAERQAGNAALQAGRAAEALAHYERFAALRPNDAGAHLNRGFVLHRLQRLPEAEAALRQAVALDTASHEAPFFLARVLADRGNTAAAEAAYAQATQRQPTFMPAWLERARLAMDKPDHAAALEATARVLALQPDHALALGMRAEALRATGQPAEALAAADAALRLDANHPLLLQARACALEALHRPEEALQAWQRVADVSPGLPAAFAGFGTALLALQRPQEALEAIDRALAAGHDDTATLNNRALALMELMRFDEAIAYLEDAVRRRPQERGLVFLLGVAQLTAGDLAAGWRHYEARASVSPLSRVAGSPRWQPGDAVAGKRVLLLSEQGLGDAVQFVRYVPLVQALGAQVVLQVAPRVKPLLEGLWPGCEIVTDAAACSGIDLHCPLMSLPHVLGRPAALETAVPYLRADASRRAHWRERIGSGPVVGLVWAGNPSHPDDRRRSVPLPLLRAAAPATGMRFVSLQYDLREGDAAILDAWPGLLHVGTEQRDLADTAALMEALDAIITVDTSVAHVAGAMGRPVFLLLPFLPDWRWRLQAERTPWYPTLHLLRQDAGRRWEPVLERAMALAQALRSP